MMEKLKKNMKPTLVLGIICIIVAALLAAVNLITEPEIERRRLEEIAKSLTEVMPGGKFNAEPDELRDDAPKTIKAVYTDQNGGGYVFVLETKTEYTKAENMGITVAVSNEGKIIDIKLTSYSESRDIGKEKYPQNYVGLDADGVAEAPLVTSVTISSAAFRSAIYDTLKYIGVASGDVSAPESNATPITPVRSDAEIEAAVLELVDGAKNAVNIAPEDVRYRPQNMPRLYKLDGDLGYVAYLVTLNRDNDPVSEGIVHIDTEGNIKAMKMISWTPDYDNEKLEERPAFTDAIVESYVGCDYWHIDSAQLVPNATGTSTDFKKAVADALRYVAINCLERSDEKIVYLASEFIPYASGFEKISTNGMPETVKRLFRVNGVNVKGGYLAHVVVPGKHTPVATEALVYYDDGGNIVDIEMLIWNVGHGVEAGSFVDGFVGKNKYSVGSAELVSSATITSEDFRNEIEKILPGSSAAIVVGAIALSLSLICFIATLIYFKRRNRAK